MGTRVRRQHAEPALLSLTGRFGLSVSGDPVSVGVNAQRLFAYLALSRGGSRDVVAGQLWPSGTHERSAASLRTTLWRLPEVCAHLVERRDNGLVLSDRLHVDVDDVEACATDVILNPGDGRTARPLVADSPLLPGWSDCWVVLERERLHLLRLEALEVAATACLDARDPARALEFALAAIRAEPLRESTWRLAISAHRDLGNLADVCRTYADYRDLMHRELGLPPSPLMRALVCQIGADLQVENLIAR